MLHWNTGPAGAGSETGPRQPVACCGSVLEGAPVNSLSHLPLYVGGVLHAAHVCGILRAPERPSEPGCVSGRALLQGHCPAFLPVAAWG